MFCATASALQRRRLGYSQLTIAGLLGYRMVRVTMRSGHVPDAALITTANQVSEELSTALCGDRRCGDPTAPLESSLFYGVNIWDCSGRWTPLMLLHEVSRCCGPILPMRPRSGAR